MNNAQKKLYEVLDKLEPALKDIIIVSEKLIATKLSFKIQELTALNESLLNVRTKLVISKSYFFTQRKDAKFKFDRALKSSFVDAVSDGLSNSEADVLSKTSTSIETLRHSYLTNEFIEMYLNELLITIDYKIGLLNATQVDVRRHTEQEH